MLVAYLSYQIRFSSSISNLTDNFFSWRMLDVYNERLADIVLTPQEGHQNQHHWANHNETISASQYREYKYDNTHPPLLIEKITFSHKGADKPILYNASLMLFPREILAITGKSGCGKSTLVKLILGIHTPMKEELMHLAYHIHILIIFRFVNELALYCKMTIFSKVL